MEIFKYLLVIVAGYLLGSISVSVCLSKGLGGDVRKQGSGNAGATNMARVYGMKAGVLTLAGDMVKSALAVLLGYLLLDDMGLMAGGVACIIGHCFPAFHGFRGGKGVSVGGLLSLVIDWRVGLLVFGSFGLFAVLSRKVSLGSVCGALAVTVGALIFHVSTPRLILAIIAMCIVIFQHRGNIKRLINGTEPDFKPKSTKKGTAS